MQGAHHFEVQVQRESRWIVEDIKQSEQAAVSQAMAVLNRGNCEAVRVVRERLGRETVVFEKKADGDAEPRTAPASAIEDAADCETVEDLMSLEARVTASKVLRKWFDANKVTPTETLHNYRVLSRLMDSDPVCYPSAVDRVASIQARRRDIDVRERRDALFRLIEEAARRTRSAEGEKAIRKLGLGTFAKLCAVADKVAWIPQERDVLVRVAVSRELIGMGDWLPKLDALLAAVSTDLEPHDLGILDGFIADVLGSPQMVQDMLGDRPNLAAALVALIDIMEGKPADDRPEPETVTVLRRMMADGRLKGAWLVLRDRVVNEVRGTRALARNDPEAEEVEFQRLVGRILSVRRLGDGPEMAHALTTRCGRRFTEGGKTGARLAVTAMGEMIGNRARRIIYFCDMLGTEMGAQLAPMIATSIRDTITEAFDIHGFVRFDESAQEKLATMGILQRAIGGADTIPPQVRKALVDRLDELICDYLQRERVIERLDDPGDTLRKRATRLVRFVASGLLVEGKALNIARARVVAHLRQPGFIENFTADLPEAAQKEAAVREFWSMLAAAGFNTGGGGTGSSSQEAAAG